MKHRIPVAFVCLIIAFSGTAAHADVVTDWNTAALNAIRANRTPPPVASRALAILHASIYDAVNGIARTHEAYAVQSAVPAGASREAAASAAAHRALVSLFPANVDEFDDLNATTLAAIPNSPQKNSGIAWGESVAQQILSLRSNGGSTAVVSPPSGSGPGVWIPTPPAFAPTCYRSGDSSCLLRCPISRQSARPALLRWPARGLGEHTRAERPHVRTAEYRHGGCGDLCLGCEIYV